jgi:hypothetical protein
MKGFSFSSDPVARRPRQAVADSLQLLLKAFEYRLVTQRAYR